MKLACSNYYCGTALFLLYFLIPSVFTIWNSLVREIGHFSTTYLFDYLYQYELDRYFFYSLGCNSVVVMFCFNCSSSGHWDLLQISSYVLLTWPIPSPPPPFLAPQMHAPSSSWIVTFPCPDSLESAISLGNSSSEGTIFNVNFHVLLLQSLDYFYAIINAIINYRFSIIKPCIL